MDGSLHMPRAEGDRGAAVRHAHCATGQVAAVASMIATERPFRDVAQQLLAARGSLDSLLLRLIEQELRDSIPNPRTRDEIDGLLRAALGRSAHGRLSIADSPRRSRQGPRAALSLEGSTLT